MLSASPAAADEAAAVQDQIAGRTFSWGKPVSGWGVNRDGSGWLMTIRQGQGFWDYTITTRRWGPAAGRFDQVRTILRGAERFAGKKLPCRLVATDGPYGDVTWRREGASKVLSMQYGCTSPTADRVDGRLDEVWSQVQAWAEGAPATEEKGAPR